MHTVRTVPALRAAIGEWRAAGSSVGLVPTMGALHEGHLSLVRRALKIADRVCVTLFVNPKQFAPNEDFVEYPRDEAADRATLDALGVHLLFAPGIEEVYPEGFATTVSVAGLSEGLCGDQRPGFFQGVATVVTKLLIQSLPDVALFGEKDYQQLQVVRRLVTDLDIPVRIEAGPTVRESDGLALSSRNAYLSRQQRSIAPALYRTLLAVAKAVSGGAPVVAALEDGRRTMGQAGFDRVEYLELRDAETLAPIQEVAAPARILAAAWLGKTRLIDNVAVEPSG
ncbi:MAG: pantoate--beta-alanine ligase [Kiloniellales bacterium]